MVGHSYTTFLRAPSFDTRVKQMRPVNWRTRRISPVRTDSGPNRRSAGIDARVVGETQKPQNMWNVLHRDAVLRGADAVNKCRRSGPKHGFERITAPLWTAPKKNNGASY